MTFFSTFFAKQASGLHDILKEPETSPVTCLTILDTQRNLLGREQIRLATNRIEESIGEDILEHPEAFGLAIKNELSPTCLLALFQTLYEKSNPVDYLFPLTAAQMLTFLACAEEPSDGELLNPPDVPRTSQLSCDQKDLVVEWVNKALAYDDFNPSGLDAPELLFTAMHYNVGSAGLRELFAIHFPKLKLPEADNLQKAIHASLSQEAPELPLKKTWLLFQILMQVERPQKFDADILCKHIAKFPEAETMEFDGRLELLIHLIKSLQDGPNAALASWAEPAIFDWIKESDCSAMSTPTKTLIFYFFLTLDAEELPSNFASSLQKEEAPIFKKMITKDALEAYCSRLGNQAAFLS